jgi:DNA (cytosine-5)-methyltransferase 1
VRLPEATHHRYRRGEQSSHDDLTLGESLVEPWVTMKQALPHRTGPFTVISNYGTGGIPGNRGRRHSHQPSATVTGKVSRNRVVAPDGTDLPRFTFAEAGQLQTFPAAYPWSGTDVSQQIGNAVPPRLGMHVISAALGLGRPTDAAFERLALWKPPADDTDTAE